MTRRTPKKVTIGGKVHPGTKREAKRAARKKKLTLSAFVEGAVITATDAVKAEETLAPENAALAPENSAVAPSAS